MDNKDKNLVNARRLLCPMPVIRTQNAIEELKPGDELKVICTDPGTLHDIPSWCRINGHEVKEVEEEKISGMREITFTICVGETN
ncbi:MAG: sulfurtransferase TusA family protein [Gammaproteobacteria bacterium]|nr:sulfurtransferase TusA family protein [Gammaproteobacteria bacterium]